MQAAVGDRITVHGKTVGTQNQVGEVIEVRGAAGAPPYRIRFSDGHEALVFPGSDATIEHESPKP